MKNRKFEFKDEKDKEIGKLKKALKEGKAWWEHTNKDAVGQIIRYYANWDSKSRKNCYLVLTDGEMWCFFNTAEFFTNTDEMS